MRAATIKAAESARSEEGVRSAGDRSRHPRPEEFRKVVQESMEKNAKVVQAVGLQAN